MIGACVVVVSLVILAVEALTGFVLLPLAASWKPRGRGRPPDTAGPVVVV